MNRSQPIRIRFTRRLSASLGAGALLLGCATNPATGHRQLMLVSEEQEIAMGRQAVQEIPATFGVYEDAALRGYVSEIGLRMASRSERPGLPWQFGVVDDPVVNAFALPGGFIYVTRGILAHFESEDQLAAVLGHEIGHVTARHSASQVSRTQLAMVGLGVGMIAKPEWAERGLGLAQAGIGVLFLKFGRDQEREADDLGFRYMSAQDYDPSGMVSVFRMLASVTASHGGGRLPNWLSTHPNPEDREARIETRLGERGAGVSDPGRRESYLRRLDGIVFGENPREGFFRGDELLHPELRFRLTLPAGWQKRNQRQAVVAGSPNQDAAFSLTLAPGASADQAARQFSAQQGVRVLEPRRARGPRGIEVLFAAQEGETRLRGLAAFLEHDGKVFRVLGYTPESRWSVYARAFADCAGSFAVLTERRILDVQPQRLSVRRLDRDTTPRQLAADHANAASPDTLAVVNQVALDDHLPRGRWVKVVVGERPPS